MVIRVCTIIARSMANWWYSPFGLPMLAIFRIGCASSLLGMLDCMGMLGRLSLRPAHSDCFKGDGTPSRTSKDRRSERHACRASTCQIVKKFHEVSWQDLPQPEWNLNLADLNNQSEPGASWSWLTFSAACRFRVQAVKRNHGNQC